MTPVGAVLSAYATALGAYVECPTEASLRDAYELGRRTMEEGAGILEVTAMHGTATHLLLSDPGRRRDPTPDFLRHTAAFLTEALSPFEMTHRGFREAHDILRRSEAQYRSLVDNAPWGIGRCTEDGAIVQANPALCDMLGYRTEPELLAASLPPGAVGRLPADIVWSRDQSHEFEATWHRADGAPVTLRMAGRRVTSDADAAVIEIMCNDVTERRTLEAQLRQAQKMEAIGRLAGGVAHEVNNFITGILLYSHLASRALGQDDPSRRHTDEIRLAAYRASLLTDQLLTFSRRDTASRRLIDLNELLTRMLPLLRPLIGKTVLLNVDLHRTPCVVRADPTQLDQVLMNLTMNACDAMPDGGRLAIETAIRTPAGQGHQVTLTISDTGCGMDAEVLQRLFEPFFTTKPPGRGTGLGLATCYAIAQQSDGSIAVHSAPGAGATFTLTLPFAEGIPDPLPDIEPDGPIPGGSETILVADDDPGVRRAVEEILRDAGYLVVSVPSGDEAIRYLEDAAPGSVDLVLTDLVMPGSDGVRVAECASARHPAIPVLIMSAHGQMPHRRLSTIPIDQEFIKKPFSPRTLLTLVRTALGEPAVR